MLGEPEAGAAVKVHDQLGFKPDGGGRRERIALGTITSNVGAVSGRLVAVGNDDNVCPFNFASIYLVQNKIGFKIESSIQICTQYTGLRGHEGIRRGKQDVGSPVTHECMRERGDQTARALVGQEWYNQHVDQGRAGGVMLSKGDHGAHTSDRHAVACGS